MGMGMGEMWGDMGRYGEMAHLAEDIVLEGGHSGAGDLSGQGVRGEVRSGGRRRRVKWGEKGREGARRGEKGREGARRGEKRRGHHAQWPCGRRSPPNAAWPLPFLAWTPRR